MLREFVLTDVATGSMDADQGQTTLEFLCRPRGFEVPKRESVYRATFLGIAAHR